MARKIYTPEFRESVINMVTQQSRSPAQAAKNLGVQEGTVRYWLKVHRQRSGLADAAEEKALRKRVRELEAENQKLKLEREILKKSSGLLRQGTAAMKFAFIQEHGGGLPVRDRCRLLGVSTSGFYRWAKEPRGKTRRRRDELAEAITRVHRSSRGVYGSPRVHRALVEEGRVVCRNTVAGVMKERGIKARTHRRFRVKTTDSNHNNPIAPNVLGRDFKAAGPDRVWLTDITYIPTDEGWLYLAGVMDLFSRRIVGWSMSEHMAADLVCDALNMALATRHPAPGAGLLHHSDRGVQYACVRYQEILKERGIAVSMSGVGNCYDNAPKESFWGKLKTELVYLERFATREQARAAVFEYIEVFYNRVRLHSSLGYLSPERFEAMVP